MIPLGVLGGSVAAGALSATFLGNDAIGSTFTLGDYSAGRLIVAAYGNRSVGAYTSATIAGDAATIAVSNVDDAQYVMIAVSTTTATSGVVTCDVAAGSRHRVGVWAVEGASSATPYGTATWNRTDTEAITAPTGGLILAVSAARHDGAPDYAYMTWTGLDEDGYYAPDTIFDIGWASLTDPASSTDVTAIHSGANFAASAAVVLE